MFLVRLNIDTQALTEINSWESIKTELMSLTFVRKTAKANKATTLTKKK